MRTHYHSVIALLLFVGTAFQGLSQTDSAQLSADPTDSLHASEAQEVVMDSLSNPMDSTLQMDTALAVDSAPKPTPPPRQDLLVSKELRFVDYLVANGLYTDAFLALDDVERTYDLLPVQRDSVVYFRGWLDYFGQDFYSAVQSLSQVDSQSDLFVKSVFYTFICYVYLDSLETAKRVLAPLDLSDYPMLDEFKHYELAGLSLKLRDYEAYTYHSSKFSGAFYLFSAEEQQLALYHSNLVNYKRKSPLVAGLLSTIIPGMGKFYAGYRGTPFGVMLTTIPLGVVAVETLILAGVISPVFIIAGGVFAVFHISNIWGSALSVTAKQREDYAQFDYDILLDMHVSVRRVFD